MTQTRRRAATMFLAAVTALGLALTGAVAAAPAQAAAPVAAPLKDKTYALSSYYGPRCMPVRGSSTYHLGQDFGASSGSDVRAVADGTVSRAGTVSGFGQWVVVDHVVDGVRFSSLYAHVIDGDQRVRKGQKVRKGQHIADVGSTGTSTSPHLHLEIWRGGYPNGKAVDPLRFLKKRGIDLTQRSTRNYARTVATSCRYFTAAKVRLRSGPGTGYGVLRTLQPNVVLTAKPGDGSGEWRKVTRSGRTGWVHRDYVSPSYTSQGTRYTLTSLNMRARPNTSSPVRRTIPADTSLTMLRDVKGDWQRVRYGSTNGWVSAQYLSDTRDGARVVPKKSGNTHSWVDVKKLYLRKGPSTSTSKVMTLRRDQRVRHLGKMRNGWLEVKHGGKRGYVASRYLTSNKP
ncbi:SH3 domain-containing protein [Isoptericola sp. CG 20/1183]|uniref:SH3 domain-containing protein n=1 Tax=Isoptericola halotolerans TaxID=300560 RepID=A0ABX5ELP1_9MICO|nr:MULTISPECIES: SH3 domain-containing protein [Isoptericola]PRZ04106.1 SH3 domain-containing protein [Isoptericola sp. CG 20/1183]PRZ10069.1 SH3 domain-containing protein [Isoptericola halotolerans]